MEISILLKKKEALVFGFVSLIVFHLIMKYIRMFKLRRIKQVNNL